MEAGLTLVVARRVGKSGGVEALADVERGNGPGERWGADGRQEGKLRVLCQSGEEKHGGGG
jgi:hypothetical protein